MAGRGRGRGRGSLSFSVETLGFGRGESLPGAILQPPPVFPPLEFKPLPLISGEEQDYLLALKQEIRNAMKESQYFIKPSDKKRDIARYSDKYTLGYQENGDIVEPDWSNLPAELKPGKKVMKRRKVVQKPGARKPNISLATKAPVNSESNITEKLEELEKKEEAQDGEKPGGVATEEGQEGEEEEEEEEYFEEEMEEETDYNLNYFDNGEDFGQDEEDDLEEGPVY